MNHKYAGGSRTGDIVIIMNGKQGYMAVNHAGDMCNGWHGGPTRAESEVPLFFSMPGPDLVKEDGKTNPRLVNDGYDETKEEFTSFTHFRNWHMSYFVRNILRRFYGN